ncbi:MAG TPA: hypothetical protein VM073_03375 [Usitatibacter sp.]|nr:hypothetical protein [Usitatibacter sp.]
MTPKMRTLAATLLIAFAPLSAHASADSVAAKIASNFATLAGSQENALALVNALRNGTDVSLTTVVLPPEGGTEPPATTTTTFTPPTGKMGWGNVKHSLALAQDALARAGVTNPTAEQLQTALVGGDIVLTNADGTTSTSTMKGILTMRADGMGWGNIAKEGGTKLGHVQKVNMSGKPVAAPPTTGEGTAAGALVVKSKGITTAAGVSAGHAPKGNAYGRGIVSGAGTATVAVVGKPGAGVVTAHGGGNAGGNGNGNGNGKGNGKGGGKPGG